MGACNAPVLQLLFALRSSLGLILAIIRAQKWQIINKNPLVGQIAGFLLFYHRNTS
jgi:hypothetical protein